MLAPLDLNAFAQYQIKRNKTKRFLSFYFPAAGHSLRRLHAMHDAPGLSYSYRSNCNSCEVIVMCPHPQFVLPRRRLHPPLDGSRPEMICLRSTFALSLQAQGCIQSPARPPSPTSPEGASENLRLLTRACISSAINHEVLEATVCPQ